MKILNYLRHRRDSALLLAALICLLIALFKPTIPLKHNIYSYILVADISQSMNVIDMKVDGKPASRMAYTQRMMHDVIASLPCGTNVSIGLFAGVSVAALYTPIEVCENFDALQDTIDHLDWRTAWSGNSRIRESLSTLARVIRTFPESAQVVYFTDGEEAPKLHAFNTKNLEDFQGGSGWLFVGIGDPTKGTEIPKYDENNQLIGFWSNESFAMQPGIAQISEANLGVRDDNVAGGENDRFLSHVDETYLKSVAKEIEADYVLGSSLDNVIQAMKEQKPARYEVAPFTLSPILAALAALFVIGAYLPKHPITAFRTRLFDFLNRRKAKPTVSISH
ncbi:MAG TPA: VWA domain-containing protein [Methylotenera sp.]|nr:VWA domain-containing protein [Methylotenera sp.]